MYISVCRRYIGTGIGAVFSPTAVFSPNIRIFSESEILTRIPRRVWLASPPQYTGNREVTSESAQCRESSRRALSRVSPPRRNAQTLRLKPNSSAAKMHRIHPPCFSTHRPLGTRLCGLLWNSKDASLPTSPSATSVAQCHPRAPTYSRALVLRGEDMALER